MTRIAIYPALALAVGLAAAFSPAPAVAKTCKAEITTKSTSYAEFSQERRARKRALANWRRKAQV
ncbi:MAG: hypothetical protein F9K44_06325 [Hyphomicrobiaceae bacterium]|nr:MAG: hypothetical protein F9K44_06325 [Hyphomicrobiaceae bacterium]